MNIRSLIVYHHWILIFWFFRLNLGSSITSPMKQTTQIERQYNTSEIALLQGNSDDKHGNVITLLLPKGEVKISIKTLENNESRKQIEDLVKSVKSAIYGLGYSLLLNTPASDHEKTNTTHADLTWRTYGEYQGARDLDLNGTDDGTEANDNTIYKCASTFGLTQTYTDYGEPYDYNYNKQSLNSDSKSEDYAYPEDEELDDDADLDLSEDKEEELRSKKKLNATLSGMDDRGNPAAENNYDSYMAPAEQEYENFGKAPTSSASCNFVGGYSIDPATVGLYLVTNAPRFLLIWFLWIDKPKYL